MTAGDRLAVLESMKMELSVTAPFSGMVRQVLVLANAQVGSGTPLLVVDAAPGQSAGRTGDAGDVRGHRAGAAAG